MPLVNSDSIWRSDSEWPLILLQLTYLNDIPAINSTKATYRTFSRAAAFLRYTYNARWKWKDPFNSPLRQFGPWRKIELKKTHKQFKTSKMYNLSSDLLLYWLLCFTTITIRILLNCAFRLPQTTPKLLFKSILSC